MAADPDRAGSTDVLERPIDWEGAERSPEFRELLAAKRRFVVPATIFFLAWYFAFILLAGYATDFMGESVYQGLTVGYCLALTQFAMVLILGIWYLRKSEKVFDPLAERAARRALDTAEADRGPARFTTTGSADDVAATTPEKRS